MRWLNSFWVYFLKFRYLKVPRCIYLGLPAITFITPIVTAFNPQYGISINFVLNFIFLATVALVGIILNRKAQCSTDIMIKDHEVGIAIAFTNSVMLQFFAPRPEALGWRYFLSLEMFLLNFIGTSAITEKFD